MITKSEFKAGENYWYSDFYDKSYAVVKAGAIYKTKKNNFWFNAVIVDNSNLDSKDKPWGAVGSEHSYSNSFIFKTKADLVAHVEVYKKVQIKALSSLLGKDK